MKRTCITVLRGPYQLTAQGEAANDLSRGNTTIEPGKAALEIMTRPIPDRYTTPEFVEQLNLIYHELEAATYEIRHPEILRHEVERWQRYLGLVQPPLTGPMRYLDIGTGTGFAARQVLRRFSGIDCILNDLSPRMIELASASLRNCFPACTITGTSLPVSQLEHEPESLDLVSMNSVLHHLPDPDGVVERIVTWLRPGGFLIVGHEPNRTFYSTRMPRSVARWAAQARRNARIYLNPASYRRRFERLSGQKQEQSAGTNLGELVVKELVRRRIIAGETEFRREWVTLLVDIHVPRERSPKDAQPGIDIGKTIIDRGLSLEVLAREDYNHLSDEAHRSPFHRSLDALLSLLCRGRGAHFGAVLRKKDL